MSHQVCTSVSNLMGMSADWNWVGTQRIILGSSKTTSQPAATAKTNEISCSSAAQSTINLFAGRAFGSSTQWIKPKRGLQVIRKAIGTTPLTASSHRGPLYNGKTSNSYPSIPRPASRRCHACSGGRRCPWCRFHLDRIWAARFPTCRWKVFSGKHSLLGKSICMWSSPTNTPCEACWSPPCTLSYSSCGSMLTSLPSTKTSNPCKAVIGSRASLSSPSPTAGKGVQRLGTISDW